MNLKVLKRINPLKTIYFNLKMFPLVDALKMPVFISYGTKFISLKGKIGIESSLKPGMIRFGFGSVGIVDKRFSRTLIELNGIIVFKGKADFGYGSKLSVGPGGKLSIGQRFGISANSSIICFNSVILGDDVLFSWDILVMDTDFHKTENTVTNEVNSNNTKPIFLGNNTWVGTRCLILKGTTIPSNTIIGAGSLVNKRYNIQENCLLAGNPAVVKKNNIRRFNY